LFFLFFWFFCCALKAEKWLLANDDKWWRRMYIHRRNHTPRSRIVPFMGEKKYFYGSCEAPNPHRFQIIFSRKLGVFQNRKKILNQNTLG
jgi:hypothetical protein